MSANLAPAATVDDLLIPDLIATCAEALKAAETVLGAARQGMATRIGRDERGRVSGAALEREQHAAHSLAWLATYVESLRQMHAWAGRLTADDRFGTLEALILQAAFGEYLAQMAGGIPMSQGEYARLEDMGAGETARRALDTAPVRALVTGGATSAIREQIAHTLAERDGSSTFGDCGLDEDYEMIRDQFRRFADEKVIPHAHEWHLNDELIPDAIIAEMSELGVFGLTIPENLGGFGMSKTAMCVVSEELSRGYIGVGSLGTRSEIAAELILGGGTDAQREEWLPKLASGEILPTAVFTEPNTGSDLGALKTRAKQENDGDGDGDGDGGGWVLTGNKTWITHAARADIMTVLARSVPGTDDHKGLSMFIAPKTRGNCADPFPNPEISGGEIEVLGYRGMKEYTVAFDDYRIPQDALLGGVEGQGFKQLMKTFESARIQTAARAIGVAQNALELGLRYAQDRIQFGKPLLTFPRVSGKLGIMAVEIMIARQLTYFSAREKDADRRCDLEAGMAKLLGARVAWSAADNALQIHGGNGFALEYPISRVLCDSRILNIFEGAAEIQAGVIARRVLES